MKNYKYKTEQSLNITTYGSLVNVTVNENNITLEVNSSSGGGTTTRIVISFSSRLLAVMRLLSVTIQTSESQSTIQISLNGYRWIGISITISITSCSNSVAFGKHIFFVIYKTKYSEPSFIGQWFKRRNKDPPNLMFYRLI